MRRRIRLWWILLSFMLPLAVFAKDPSLSLKKFLSEKMSEKSEEFSGKKGDENPFFVIQSKSSKFFVESIEAGIKNGTYVPVIGRDAERDQVMDVLVRPKGRTPVLLGPAGVGKTAIIQAVAEAITQKKFPDTNVYTSNFANAEIIETTPALLSSLAKSDDPAAQAMAVELFFRSVQQVELAYEKATGVKKNLIVFIDECHTLTDPQIEALKRFQEDMQHPVRIIEASTSSEFELRFKYNPAAKRRREPIAVPEFDIPTTLSILEQSWLPFFNTQFNVQFSEEALQTVMKVSAVLKPGLARPEAPFKVLQELAGFIHRKNNGAVTTVEAKDVYDYVVQKTRLPVNPFDPNALHDYLENLRTQMQARIKGQDHIINELIELWRQVLTGPPTQPKVMLVVGNTGVGKSVIFETFAEIAFGSKGRSHKIIGSSLAQGGYAVSSEFGVPPGVRVGERTSGRLMEFMDDPARGKMGGIIQIEEGEKMPLDAWMPFLEFFGNGILPGGDGGLRHANRHIVVITSNKGADEFFPPSRVKWSEKEVDTRRKQINEQQIKNTFLQPNLDKPNEVVLPPELTGRIHKAVLANPMVLSLAKEVGVIEVAQFQRHTKESFEIDVQVSPEATEYLSITGMDFLEGFRPSAQQIQESLTRIRDQARKKWSLGKGDKIEIGLDVSDETRPFIVAKNAKGETIKIDAPKPRDMNPLLDEDVRSRLDKLEAVMLESMGEQPEAVAALVRGLRSRIGDIARKRPIAVTVVSSTGTGKTALGRALAKAWYGSEDRAKNMPVGDKKTDKDMQIFFGTDEGSVRNKALSIFERALRENPEGGVLMIDEFSNVGGNNPETKNSILKMFYDILEEGIYVSPRDGSTTYDLSKYIFLFTGNDLEDLFIGVRTDEQRRSIWRKVNNPETLHHHLVTRGVPEALLSRMAAVISMRPLDFGGQSRISKKLFDEYSARALEQHKGIEISTTPEFFDQLAFAFFTHDKGARSVRAVIDNHITSIVTEALLASGYTSEMLKGMNLILSLKDNAEKKPYSRTSNMSERIVEICVTAIKDNKTVTEKCVNATSAAATVVTLTRESAKSIAYREAGRAVVNDELLTQEALEFSSVRAFLNQGEVVLGYSNYSAISREAYQVTRKRTVARLARYYGARLAQELKGYESDVSWKDDLKAMRELATDYFVKYGLNDGLDALRLNERGEPVLSREQQDRLENEMKLIFSEAKTLAESALQANKSLLHRVAAELMRKSELSGERLAQIRKIHGKTTCSDLLSPKK